MRTFVLSKNVLVFGLLDNSYIEDFKVGKFFRRMGYTYDNFYKNVVTRVGQVYHVKTII